MGRQVLTLHCAHVDCEHDAAAIERGLRKETGVVAVEVYPRSARVNITYDPEMISSMRLQGRLRALGFPPYENAALPTGPPKPWRNPKVLTSAAAGALLLAGWLAGRAGASGALSLVLYLAGMLSGGY